MALFITYLRKKNHTTQIKINQCSPIHPGRPRIDGRRSTIDSPTDVLPSQRRHVASNNTNGKTQIKARSVRAFVHKSLARHSRDVSDSMMDANTTCAACDLSSTEATNRPLLTPPTFRPTRLFIIVASPAMFSVVRLPRHFAHGRNCDGEWKWPQKCGHIDRQTHLFRETSLLQSDALLLRFHPVRAQLQNSRNNARLLAASEKGMEPRLNKYIKASETEMDTNWMMDGWRIAIGIVWGTRRVNTSWMKMNWGLASLSDWTFKACSDNGWKRKENYFKTCTCWLAIMTEWYRLGSMVFLFES